MKSEGDYLARVTHTADEPLGQWEIVTDAGATWSPCSDRCVHGVEDGVEESVPEALLTEVGAEDGVASDVLSIRCRVERGSGCFEQ